MIPRPSTGLVAPDGAPLTWLGVNSWSRAGGPRVAWLAGRDLYANGWMLVRQAFFARAMAERFGAHPSLPNANPEATWWLYRALGVSAGVERGIRSARPEVLVDWLLHRDGACYVWAVSASERSVCAAIDLAGDGWLEDLESGERAGATLELPPYGVRVFRWMNWKGASG